MKTILIILTILFFSITSFGQSTKYESVGQCVLKIMDEKGLSGNDMFNMVKEECERLMNSKTIIEVDKTKGLFMSVGSRGTILTSSDGTSWTQRTSGTSEYLNGVTYGNGLFVTVGDYGTILTSSNKTSWTERTSGTSEFLRGVTYSQ